MTLRYASRVGLMAGLALLLAGAPALGAPRSAASPHRPLASVSFTNGPAAPFNATRFDGEYDPTTNRVYFLGFRTDADATDGSVWYYDVATQTYTDTGVDMPVPVSNYQIAPLTDARGLGFYIFGGRDANAALVNTTQVYYPALNQAKIVAGDPWPGTTPSGCISLPGTGVAVVSNTAIVAGGFSTAANGCVDDSSAQTWLFHPNAHNGARWTQGPDLSLARTYITMAVLGKTVYAIGGDTFEAATLVPQTIVESWKPPTGGWNDAGVADSIEPCDESQGFGNGGGPLKGDIVVAGCGQWPNAVGDVLLYSSTTNTWSVAGALNVIRRNEAGSFIPFGTQTRMYILGGYGADSNFIDPINSSEVGKGQQVDAAGRRPSRAGSAGVGLPTS